MHTAKHVAEVPVRGSPVRQRRRVAPLRLCRLRQADVQLRVGWDGGRRAHSVVGVHGKDLQPTAVAVWCCCGWVGNGEERILYRVKGLVCAANNSPHLQAAQFCL
jgi:hypothetical protein